MTYNWTNSYRQKPKNFDYMREEERHHMDKAWQAVDTVYIPSARIIIDMGSAPGKSIPNVPVTFRRGFLYENIGGSSRRTWCIVPASHPARKVFPKLTNYVCARPDFSPYLPQYPSEHGVMYDWKEDTIDVPQVGSIIPLFITISSSEWQYCGNYELMENLELNVEEWESCPSSVKDIWYVVSSNVDTSSQDMNLLF